MNESRLGSSEAVRVLAVTGVWLVAASGPASAMDGVIEINQARAVAGGVTTTDSAGFPVTLDAGGSYLLTTDLEVPDGNTTAISVSADHIALNLNGFSILGPAVCSGNPISCTNTGTGIGIDGRHNSAEDTFVKNGTVRGMGSYGLYLSTGAHVESVRAISNGSAGISMTSDCSIANSHSRNNGGYGIYGFGTCVVLGNVAVHNGATGIGVQAGSVVRNNTASDNDSYGIFLSGACLVSGNSIYSNSGAGLFASRGSNVVNNTITYNAGDGVSSNGQATITGNTISGNTAYGLDLNGSFGEDGYGGNSITSNNGSNANAQVRGGSEIGTNICGTNTTCP